MGEEVYSFSIAAIKNNHKFSHLQQYLLSYSSVSQKSRYSLTQVVFCLECHLAEIKVLAGMLFFLEALGMNLCPCSFS